ncbi:HAMP domain-containing histidine kinase, partial [uncultured Limosilactobacillus sp.]|uniref:HAMP domain-containing sensor histidine kinase n=1 Tax=uncultured Limosilactobacillus sp. TaxID=2837629 RepID=UPI0025F2E197
MNSEQGPQKRFISLKVKWAIGTALGAFVIFVALASTLFWSFNSDLLNQEKKAVNSSASTISRRLESIQQTPLTRQTVQDRLIKHQSARANGHFYKTPVVEGLADSHLIVTVYDLQGHPVFSTGRPQKGLEKSKRVAPAQMVKGDDHRILLARHPLRRSDNHQLIGYLQVENLLQSYYQRFYHMAVIALLLLLLVVLLSGLLGYFLTYFLLSPLNSIHSTLEEVSADPTRDVRVEVSSANDELAELGRMFNKMLDQTQRYINQQSQFVGDVSHELRTPMAIIQGHIQMLQRWGKEKTDILDESIDAIMQETKRMNNLVKEMLDLSRAEQVDIQFRDATTVVNDVVNQVYNDFKMIHPDFVFMLDDDLHRPVKVQIHRDHLEQILIILCDNAIKYSTERKEVHLTLSKSLNAVEIAVQDFGEGIAPEETEKVFDRFYRVDKARSRKKGGNG